MTRVNLFIALYCIISYKSAKSTAVTNLRLRQSYGYGSNTDWPSGLGGHSTEEESLLMLAQLPRPKATTATMKVVKRAVIVN